MIAVDTNILVYAHRPDSPLHGPALRCLEELAGSGARWAIPWPCIVEFLCVVTHPRIYDPPTPLETALRAVDALLEAPTLGLLAEDGDAWPDLREAARAGRIAGPVVYDARIAALCRSRGVRELWTADRDYSKFPGLAVRNPLESGGARRGRS